MQYTNIKLSEYVLCSGALAWNGDILSSGSRDRLILQRDIRTPSSIEARLVGHRQEVLYNVMISTNHPCVGYFVIITMVISSLFPFSFKQTTALFS